LHRGAPSAPPRFACSTRSEPRRNTVFAAATSDAFDTFQSILKINMITVQVKGSEMAWVCENHFGTEPNVQMAHSIETFAWDDDGNLLIKTYYPMPESVGGEADPYAHLLEGHK
jgi:hypothetical protein